MTRRETNRGLMGCGRDIICAFALADDDSVGYHKNKPRGADRAGRAPARPISLSTPGKLGGAGRTFLGAGLAGLRASSGRYVVASVIVR